MRARNNQSLISTKKERELSHVKATAKMSVNIALIGISFTIFTLILTLKPELLRNEFLSLQLVSAIPFLISSTLARMSLVNAAEQKRWETYGFIGFVLAYSFLVNVIGILLASFVSIGITLVFFVINIIAALIYSSIEVSYDRNKLKERILKDLIFILIVIFLGILPSLNI